MVFDIQNVLDIAFTMSIHKVVKKKIIKIWNGTVYSNYPTVTEFNQIQMEFDIRFDGVRFGSDFQIQLLLGSYFDVRTSNPNSIRCYLNFREAN